ncbi:MULTISPECIES: DUF6325 family protein [Streptomyces]|uniref:DUF6325 family protein n=1 Tax=Streptomyces sp. JL1001 TaxID=3078227 RepID=A0AAU8KQL5_9ACTN|nr:DUF6325 family protein [Streptomyces sp. Termitarium-T10T-6]SCE49271.1 hypothetical protein GA0115253_1059512 [Streptomyces sp. Termitarium-T10T-6]
MPRGLQADTVGPVDVAVIAFEGNRFDGRIVPALRELQLNETVRILDLAFVSKARDSSVAVLELSDPGVAETLRQVTDVQFDLLSDEDLRTVSDSLTQESSALVVAWENTWAARLSAAVRGSEGELVMLERVPREAVLEAISALDDH